MKGGEKKMVSTSMSPSHEETDMDALKSKAPMERTPEEQEVIDSYDALADYDKYSPYSEAQKQQARERHEKAKQALIDNPAPLEHPVEPTTTGKVPTKQTVTKEVPAKKK